MNYLLPYANLAISWGLLILIWLVQLIIYPGFQRISRDAFAAYHRWYVIRIAAVVLPLMVAELVLTIWWVLSDAYSPISLSAGFFHRLDFNLCAPGSHSQSVENRQRSDANSAPGGDQLDSHGSLEFESGPGFNLYDQRNLLAGSIT
jgi:hypothetical protein